MAQKRVRDWSGGTSRSGRVCLRHISTGRQQRNGKQRTFVIRIQKVIVGISERKLVSDRRDLVPSVKVPPQLAVGERLDELSLRLNGSTWQTTDQHQGAQPLPKVVVIPITSRFLSGKRFPLATESSMELHMSFFSPFLPSEPEAPEALV